jgi:hypothetical protein
MAKVALFLCLLFIILALKNDTKEYRRFPKSLWVPLLWLGEISSRPFSFWLSASPAADPGDIVNEYIQGDPVERVILIAFISFGIFILVKRRRRFSVSFRENRWLILLYVFTLMSVGWSDYPGVTIKRCIKSIGDIVMALILLSEDDHLEAIEHVVRRIVIVLVPLSVLFVKFYPDLGIFYTPYGLRAWTGVTTGKNELGVLCAFFGIFLIWRILKIRPKINPYDAVLLMLIIYLLNGAKSATSIVIFIVGVLSLAVMIILKNNPSRISSVITTFLVLIISLQVVLMAFLNTSISDLFFSAAGRDSTLTGRTDIWSALIAIGMQSPILGAGYGSFWLTNMVRLREQLQLYNTIIQAHNGYLEIFLNLGIIGLCLLIIVLLQTYKRLRNSLGTAVPMGNLFFTYFLMMILHNFTEASIMVPTYFVSFLLFLLAVVVVKNTEAKSTEL